MALPKNFDLDKNLGKMNTSNELNEADKKLLNQLSQNKEKRSKKQSSQAELITQLKDAKTALINKRSSHLLIEKAKAFTTQLFDSLHNYKSKTLLPPPTIPLTKMIDDTIANITPTTELVKPPPADLAKSLSDVLDNISTYVETEPETEYNTEDEEENEPVVETKPPIDLGETVTQATGAISASTQLIPVDLTSQVDANTKQIGVTPVPVVAELEAPTNVVDVTPVPVVAELNPPIGDITVTPETAPPSTLEVPTDQIVVTPVPVVSELKPPTDQIVVTPVPVIANVDVPTDDITVTPVPVVANVEVPTDQIVVTPVPVIANVEVPTGDITVTPVPVVANVEVPTGDITVTPVPISPPTVEVPTNDVTATSVNLLNQLVDEAVKQITATLHELPIPKLDKTVDENTNTITPTRVIDVNTLVDDAVKKITATLQLPTPTKVDTNTLVQAAVEKLETAVTTALSTIAVKPISPIILDPNALAKMITVERGVPSNPNLATTVADALGKITTTLIKPGTIEGVMATEILPKITVARVGDTPKPADTQPIKTGKEYMLYGEIVEIQPQQSPIPAETQPISVTSPVNTPANTITPEQSMPKETQPISVTPQVITPENTIKPHIQAISDKTTKPSLFFNINTVKETSYKNDTTNSDEIWLHFKENAYTIDMKNPNFTDLVTKLKNHATTILSNYKSKKYIHVFVKVDDTSSSIHKLNGILLSDAPYGVSPGTQ